MTDRAAYLVLWIPVASWLDAAGVRVTVPAHLVGVSVPWVRRGRTRRRPTWAERLGAVDLIEAAAALEDGAADE